VSPDVVRSYRWQLTPGEDVIDTATWAGSIPQVTGIAPRVRIGRNKWFNLLWLLPFGFLLLISAIAIAKVLRDQAPGLHQEPRNDGAAAPRCDSGLPRVGSLAALLQPDPDELHHPFRDPDPLGLPSEL
jgi:sulfoxide reductase catalytic subunit YedY